MLPVRSLAELDLARLYTYADYCAWEFEGWEELHRGRLVLPPASYGTAHQTVAGNLLFLIAQQLRRQTTSVYHRISVALPRPESSVIDTVVVPDLCVICDPAKLDERGCIGAPDWIIEILSPGTAGRDMTEKFQFYEENGVGEYWIVAPGEKNISVFVRDHDRYRLLGDYWQPGPVPVHTLPELVVEWREVFGV